MISLSERRYKQFIVVFVDAFAIALSIYLSYCMRFGTYLPSEYMQQIYRTLPVMIAMRISVFAFMGLYRGIWRFVGMRDLALLIKAITLSSILSVVVLFLLNHLESYPRSIFIIDWFVLMVIVGGVRFSYRFYHDTISKRSSIDQKSGKNILIVGAGRAGDLILREIIGSYHVSYTPIGFVDDDRKKRNLTIHGYRVLGNTREIPAIAKQYDVAEIFIAIPSSPYKTRRRILHTCKRAKVKCKMLPAVGDLLSGKVSVNALREFQIEDLLGREPASLDNVAIREYLKNKTILITGAGGSIGSELCHQIAQFSPECLIMYDQSEYNLYKIQMTMKEKYPGLKVHAIIGDIVNHQRVEQTLKQFKPEVVFHAAAYKHVPLMELNAQEALSNNVYGTWIVAHLCHAYEVKKFVMVSTDKAVRPTNIMGASKRIAEIICQGFSKNSRTKFVTVRFGNVLNSVGSVIPLFKQQIAAGGPVTVTHPEIYRYFMTIPEAAQLIMQAGAMGRGGEIFILDMVEPVKIVDLARDMITLSGLEPDKDVKIVFSGLRPGEKLYEELLTEGEEIKSTLHEKIKIAGAVELEWTSMIDRINNLLDHLPTCSRDELVSHVKEIVPEFQPEKEGTCNVDPVLRDFSYEVERNAVDISNEASFPPST